MPLDDTGRIIDPPTIALLDPLTRMGITPVPDDFVSEYKKQYRENWLMMNNYGAGKPGPFVWQTYTYSAWADAVKRYGGSSSRLTLEKFLASGFWREDSTPAPQALVDLAKTVQQDIPDAAFSVDYFYTDPVLNVCYSVGDASRTVCLGIWDHGVLKAIADHPMAKAIVPRRRGLLSWIIPSSAWVIMLVATMLTWS